MKKVAIPALSEGLDGQLSGHFGHVKFFTMITYDEESNEIENVEKVSNAPHQVGGCMAPVMALKEAGADSVVVGGIGGRPLMGFLQVGIDVYGGKPGTIKDNFEAFASGDLEQVSQSTCSGAQH